jgi:glycosyl transferase, family 25
MSDEFSGYVINLEYRNDRRMEMEEQLRRVGWRAQFSHSERPNDAAGFPSIGSRGCFLSHLEMLRRGVVMKDRHVLIMEDDLNFVPGFGRLWDEVYDELKAKDWSIFYPGHVLDNTPNGLSMMGPKKGILCTHFMLFNRAVVPRIIEALEAILARPAGHPLGGPMHVDGAYSTIRAQNPDLKTYVYSPSLGLQRSSRSDIADLKFYDRIEALRPVLNTLRRFKRRLAIS